MQHTAAALSVPQLCREHHPPHPATPLVPPGSTTWRCWWRTAAWWRAWRWAPASWQTSSVGGPPPAPCCWLDGCAPQLRAPLAALLASCPVPGHTRGTHLCHYRRCRHAGGRVRGGAARPAAPRPGGRGGQGPADGAVHVQRPYGGCAAVGRGAGGGACIPVLPFCALCTCVQAPPQPVCAHPWPAAAAPSYPLQWRWRLRASCPRCETCWRGWAPSRWRRCRRASCGALADERPRTSRPPPVTVLTDRTAL